MLNISIDLGDVPSVLAALASEQTVIKATYVAAEGYIDDVLETIHSGRSFKTRTGQLEQSVNWTPAGNDSALVFANAKHAPYVEFGTRPHVISAKNRKALKIPSAGGFFFRKSVNHPGSRPFPFFYTDMGNREQKMMNRIRSVLAEAGAND